MKLVSIGTESGDKVAILVDDCGLGREQVSKN